MDDAPVRYAAFLEIMDHHVGRVLAAVDESGQAGNTLVIVTSDNGGHPRFTDSGGLRGSKWTLYEGGIRVPWLVRWSGVVAPGTVSMTPLIGTDLFPTLAEVAGAVPPARELDGVNLLPVWRDPGGIPRASPADLAFPVLSRALCRRDAGLGNPGECAQAPASLRGKPLRAVRPRRRSGGEKNLSAERPAEAAALREMVENTLRAEQARMPRAREG